MTSAPSELRPLLEAWPAGRPIIRVHPSTFGATEFNADPKTNGRFHPLRHGRRIVPVLYGAGDDAAAASETVFHTVPAPEGPEVRPRQVALAPWLAWVWSTLAARRDLQLVSLRGNGLRAIGARRDELITSPRTAWPTARTWAEALLVAAPEADGLRWTSRQAPRRDALVLFGKTKGRTGGIQRAELEVVNPPVPFLSPAGLERLMATATKLDITLLIE